jgi:PPOX class probable F420-dependent enzyme
MLPRSVLELVSENHTAALTTFRRSGAAQMSIVSTGPYRGGVAFSACDFRAKVVNLQRDPRCTLLVSRSDWSEYVVMEGRARISSLDNTDAEKLRLEHRDLQRLIAGQEHPDWKEYDEEMRTGRYAIVVVLPEHYYGWIGGEVRNDAYFAGSPGAD